MIAVDDAQLTAARRVASALVARGERLAVAESCTGGGVTFALTALPGSSDWFERGYVTYSNAAKVADLGVSPGTLEAHGAVSEPTAREMASGAASRAGAPHAVSVTGIAGPSGGSAAKPVGTVCFGWSVGGRVVTETRHFAGDRATVRAQSVAHALERLAMLLGG